MLMPPLPPNNERSTLTYTIENVNMQRNGEKITKVKTSSRWMALFSAQNWAALRHPIELQENKMNTQINGKLKTRKCMSCRAGCESARKQVKEWNNQKCKNLPKRKQNMERENKNKCESEWKKKPSKKLWEDVKMKEKSETKSCSTRFVFRFHCFSTRRLNVFQNFNSTLFFIWIIQYFAALFLHSAHTTA